MLYALKGQFQLFAKKFGYKYLSANKASVLGALFALLAGASLFAGFQPLNQAVFLPLFAVFSLLRLVFNALDGMLARAQNTASPMGELANELGDIWGDTLCYGTLYFVSGVNSALLGVFLICCWFSEFVGVCGRALPGQVRRHESAFGGKSERALLFSVYCVVCFFQPAAIDYINPFLALLSVLAFITGIVRVNAVKKQTRGLEYESRAYYGQ